MEFGNQIKDRLRGSVIEVAGRLICHEHLRPCDQCPGQGNALLLSPGQFAGPMVRPVEKPNFLKPMTRLRFRFAPSQTPHQQRHADVLDGSKFG